MFKTIFYNLLWFLSLTSAAFNVSGVARSMFDGTITELIVSLILFLFSVFTFVTVDYRIKKDNI
jgi:hypothetical protein